MADPAGTSIMKRFIAATATFGFVTAAALGLANAASVAPLADSPAVVDQLTSQGYVD